MGYEISLNCTHKAMILIVYSDVIEEKRNHCCKKHVDFFRLMHQMSFLSHIATWCDFYIFYQA